MLLLLGNAENRWICGIQKLQNTFRKSILMRTSRWPDFMWETYAAPHVSVSYCCVTNHPISQWLKTISIFNGLWVCRSVGQFCFWLGSIISLQLAVCKVNYLCWSWLSCLTWSVIFHQAIPGPPILREDISVQGLCRPSLRSGTPVPATLFLCSKSITRPTQLQGMETWVPNFWCSHIAKGMNTETIKWSH